MEENQVTDQQLDRKSRVTAPYRFLRGGIKVAAAGIKSVRPRRRQRAAPVASVSSPGFAYSSEEFGEEHPFASRYFQRRFLNIEANF